MRVSRAVVGVTLLAGALIGAFSLGLIAGSRVREEPIRREKIVGVRNFAGIREAMEQGWTVKALQPNSEFVLIMETTRPPLETQASSSPGKPVDTAASALSSPRHP